MFAGVLDFGGAAGARGEAAGGQPQLLCASRRLFLESVEDEGGRGRTGRIEERGMGVTSQHLHIHGRAMESRAGVQTAEVAASESELCRGGAVR